MKNVIIFGRYDTGLIDNSKYLYLYYMNRFYSEKNINLFFLAENDEVYNVLNEKKFPVLRYGEKKLDAFLKNTDLLILSNWIIREKFENLLNKRTKILQMWHGIPLKNVSHIMKTHDYYPKKYDFFLSTSDFMSKNAFKKIFNAKNYINLGYPRNDIFFSKEYYGDLIYLNIDALNFEKIINFKERGKNIACIMPTLNYINMVNADMILSGILNLNALDRLAKKYDTLFVLKLHPALAHMIKVDLIKKYNNLVFYNYAKDIYPLLPYIDVLITDYSSVYFDFLLLNKPIIFYSPDIKTYEKNKLLIFNYNEFAPGEKAYNFAQLKRVLKKVIYDKQDDYEGERKNIKKLSFDFIDGCSSQRVCNKIFEILEVN